MVGERGGKTLDGFDLGNSPVAVTPEVVREMLVHEHHQRHPLAP